ncbi:MAG: hypothetical protein MJ181_01065 [Treponema sp.]|nr:hypothetical protein [Treponema sp.]
MRIKEALLFILIFSFCTFGLSAAKKKDKDIMSLSQIDALIKETRYDQAMEELNKYIEEYPENFDNAQSRIEKIMNARNRYSRLAEELITVILEEPDNSEKIYKITYELEHLEKYPSDRQLAFIRETRIAAEFNYFRKEYGRIHEETENLIQGGNYVAAVKKAQEGFGLYKENFFEEWTQKELTEPVNQALTDIDALVLRYNDFQKNFGDSVTVFVTAVEKESQEDIAAAWQNVQTDFMELASIRNGIYTAGDTFKKAFELQKELSDTELTDASFLPFVTRFTVGQNDNPDTGIAGAMNSQWDSAMYRMRDAIDSKLDKYVQSFLSAMPDKIMTSNKSALNMEVLPVIRQYSNLAVRVNNLNNQLSPDLHEEQTSFYDKESRYAYELPVRTEELYSIKERTLSRFEKLVAMKVPENPVEAELAGNSYTDDLVKALSSLGFTDEEEEYLATVADVDLQKDLLVALREKFENYTSELFTYTKDTRFSSTKDFTEYVKSAGSGFVERSRKKYDSARLLLEGTSDENSVMVFKYPEKSKTQAEELNREIDAQIANITHHIDQLPELGELTDSDGTRNQLAGYIVQLKDCKSESATLADACRVQITNSNKAINEAELRFRQAETALQADNFDTARKRLQDARTKYNEALAYSFSEELQASSDSSLMALGERIIQKENEIVVADVRRMKTQAKNEYYAGNFEQAENLLTQASVRWAVTNVEEDMEISSLRALVNSALSMKTGRVILPSAPLYPEMSQILNIASQYYAEGEEYIKAGKRDEGVASLEAALKKIQEVQLVYPLNQDASLLSLRIQKVLNPSDFDSMFARKVAEAKASYKDKTKAQESYADLLDLYEINSKYPGLKDLIYNVELEIGIRQKPVTKVVSNKSQDLTKEAQNIFNRAKGDETQLKNALAKLDEAIDLNPNNTAAINLKDKIQVSIGGKASAVLSAEDENRYQIAIMELQNNNIITANAIVEQLLQKDSNKNSTKILELRKKIKALL